MTKANETAGQEVAVKDEKNQVAVPSNLIQDILKAAKEEFEAANAGMGLDFVRMGDYLKLSKLGQFVEHNDETVSYGNTLDVVVAMGEPKYTLWGADGSPEKGELIVMEDTEPEAQAALENWIMQDQSRGDRYSLADIRLRYLAYIVPTQFIGGADEIPKVYLMNFSTSDTYGWGQYARNVFNGKYKPLGVPSKCGVNRVVTRLTSEVRKNPDNESYVGIKFDPIGLFKPEDFGIKA